MSDQKLRFLLRKGLGPEHLNAVGEELEWRAEPPTAGQEGEERSTRRWSSPDGDQIVCVGDSALGVYLVEITGHDLDQISWNTGRYGISALGPRTLRHARDATTPEERLYSSAALLAIFLSLPEEASALMVGWYTQGDAGWRLQLIEMLRRAPWRAPVELLSALLAVESVPERQQQLTRLIRDAT